MKKCIAALIFACGLMASTGSAYQNNYYPPDRKVRESGNFEAQEFEVDPITHIGNWYQTGYWYTWVDILGQVWLTVATDTIGHAVAENLFVTSYVSI